MRDNVLDYIMLIDMIVIIMLIGDRIIWVRSQNEYVYNDWSFKGIHRKHNEKEKEELRKKAFLNLASLLKWEL